MMNGWETCRAAMNLAAAEYWATGSITIVSLWIGIGFIFACGLVIGGAAAFWRQNR